MQLIEQRVILSPSDLVAHRSCDLVGRLAFAVRSGLMPPPERPVNGTLELAKRYGDAHERRVLAWLRSQHGEAGVVQFDRPKSTLAALQAADEATRAALLSGVPVIYQPTFFDGGLVGYADFLLRTGTDASTGMPVYEPYDTKLARSVKTDALLQLAAYAHQLMRLGFAQPERVWVWLGSGERSGHALRPLLPVLNRTRDDLTSALAGGPSVPSPSFGAPRAACGHCSFALHCEEGRERARDLALVAGMRSDQRRKLVAAGLATVEALATASDAERPADLREETFKKVRAQARLQAAQDASRSEASPDGVPSFEVYAPQELALLPPASPGDVFFDMEGDTFAEAGEGLEYLFGVVTIVDGVDRFQGFWAHDRAEEKRAFEALVDLLVERMRADPGAHVYHYASYEATALARLAQRHATREAEVDALLRRQRLVNLYPLVTRSLRISQRSYSIKKLEPFYMADARSGDVTTAGDSIVQYERAAELRAVGENAEAQAILDEIERYNERDCVSTRALRDWLAGLQRVNGVTPTVQDATATDAPEKTKREEADEETERLVDRLLDGVPAEPSQRSDVQSMRAMLAAAAGFHRREQRVDGQEYYRLLDAPRDVLERERDVALVESHRASPWQPAERATRSIEITTVDSGLQLKGGEAISLFYDDVDSGSGTRIASEAKVVDMRGATLTCSETASGSDGHGALVLKAIRRRPAFINTSGPVGAIHRCAEEILDANGALPRRACLELIARRPPFVGPDSLPRTGDPIADVLTALRRVDRSYVAVQGPPGTGKTYVGARVVAELVRAGWHVGVVAQSHAAVANLLRGARDAGLDPSCIARAKPNGAVKGSPEAEFTVSDIWAFRAKRTGGVLLGGTVFTFTNAGARAQEKELDLLVIEEAGQYSIANTIAASWNARNLLLLGDPQQLDQVARASHTESVDSSALAWLMQDAAVMPDHLGYFLDASHRMHPAVCHVVSELAYDGRLRSAPEASERALEGVAPGVHPEPVDHEGCTTESPLEVEAAVRRARALIGQRWNDGKGTRALGPRDVLVVAPYNLQVDALRRAFDAEGLTDVRVGTVDKFQGQEAPLVIVSMTTSSAEESPRGLGFVLSTSRLNVAISRAQWAAYVLYSPYLCDAPAATPEALALVGGFIGVVTPPPASAAPAR